MPHYPRPQQLVAVLAIKQLSRASAQCFAKLCFLSVAGSCPRWIIHRIAVALEVKTVRWILFIPLGALLGFLFALPIIFFYNLWNLDNVFFTSLVKNGFSTYFVILSMAWVVPKGFELSGFKTFASILFGCVLGISSLALLGQRDAGSVLSWEYSGEALGLTLGYLSAVHWDKNSIKALLSKTKGASPYTAYSVTGDN